MFKKRILLLGIFLSIPIIQAKLNFEKKFQNIEKTILHKITDLELQQKYSLKIASTQEPVDTEDVVSVLWSLEQGKDDLRSLEKMILELSFIIKKLTCLIETQTKHTHNQDLLNQKSSFKTTHYNFHKKYIRLMNNHKDLKKFFKESPLFESAYTLFNAEKKYHSSLKNFYFSIFVFLPLTFFVPLILFNIMFYNHGILPILYFALAISSFDSIVLPLFVFSTASIVLITVSSAEIIYSAGKSMFQQEITIPASTNSDDVFILAEESSSQPHPA